MLFLFFLLINFKEIWKINIRNFVKYGHLEIEVIMEFKMISKKKKICLLMFLQIKTEN